MVQVRKDYLTDESVIIATIRGSRPRGVPELITEAPGFECPFCAGKEKSLPPAKLVYLKDSSGNFVSKAELGEEREGSWLVKVLDNKYPVFTAEEQSSEILSDKGLKYTVPYGIHELVIDNPLHSSYFHMMNSESVKLLFQVYKERFIDLARDGKIEFISISKNHGPKSGGTMLHPHSHIVSSSILPERIRKELTTLEAENRCVFEEIISREKSSPRFIIEQQSTVAFCPYASQFPYEVWLFPKSHANNVTKLNDDELTDLALTLRDIARGLDNILDKASYNFIFNQTLKQENYHMYIRIFPRFYFETGFEISFGMPVNEVPPEKAAEEIRRYFGG